MKMYRMNASDWNNPSDSHGVVIYDAEGQQCEFYFVKGVGFYCRQVWPDGTWVGSWLSMPKPICTGMPQSIANNSVN